MEKILQELDILEKKTRITRQDCIKLEELKEKSTQFNNSATVSSNEWTKNFENYLKFCTKYSALKQRIGRDLQLPPPPNLDFPIIIPRESLSPLFGNKLQSLTYPMASFDFGIALKLDELTSTKAADIATFIGIIKCYYDTLSDDGRTALINFVVAAKIKAEARVRFGAETPTSLSELEKVLYEKVLAAETEEELINKLHNVKQGKRSLKDYAAVLSDLSVRLAAVMARKSKVESKEGKKIVKETCEKLALNQFRTFCHDEVKLILAAAQPTTLDEALAVATASNLDTPGVYTVKNWSRNKGQNQWRPQSNSYQNQWRPRQNNSYQNQWRPQQYSSSPNQWRPQQNNGRPQNQWRPQQNNGRPNNQWKRRLYKPTTSNQARPINSCQREQEYNVHNYQEN